MDNLSLTTTFGGASVNGTEIGEKEKEAEHSPPEPNNNNNNNGTLAGGVVPAHEKIVIHVGGEEKQQQEEHIAQDSDGSNVSVKQEAGEEELLGSPEDQEADFRVSITEGVGVSPIKEPSAKRSRFNDISLDDDIGRLISGEEIAAAENGDNDNDKAEVEGTIVDQREEPDSDAESVVCLSDSPSVVIEDSSSSTEKTRKRRSKVFYCRWTECITAGLRPFSSARELYMHCSSAHYHLGVNRCLWEGCNKFFSRGANFRRHFKAFHMEKLLVDPDNETTTTKTFEKRITSTFNSVLLSTANNNDDDEMTTIPESTTTTRSSKVHSGGSYNGYILFSTTVYNRVREANPGAGFAEISRLVGQEWRQLTAEERSRFNEVAYERRLSTQQKASSNSTGLDRSSSLSSSSSPAAAPVFVEQRSAQKKFPASTNNKNNNFSSTSSTSYPSSSSISNRNTGTQKQQSNNSTISTHNYNPRILPNSSKIIDQSTKVYSGYAVTPSSIGGTVGGLTAPPTTILAPTAAATATLPMPISMFFQCGICRGMFTTQQEVFSHMEQFHVPQQQSLTAASFPSSSNSSSFHSPPMISFPALMNPMMQQQQQQPFAASSSSLLSSSSSAYSSRGFVPRSSATSLFSQQQLQQQQKSSQKKQKEQQNSITSTPTTLQLLPYQPEDEEGENPSNNLTFFELPPDHPRYVSPTESCCQMVRSPSPSAGSESSVVEIKQEPN